MFSQSSISAATSSDASYSNTNASFPGPLFLSKKHVNSMQLINLIIQFSQIRDVIFACSATPEDFSNHPSIKRLIELSSVIASEVGKKLINNHFKVLKNIGLEMNKLFPNIISHLPPQSGNWESNDLSSLLEKLENLPSDNYDALTNKIFSIYTTLHVRLEENTKLFKQTLKSKCDAWPLNKNSSVNIEESVINAFSRADLAYTNIALDLSNELPGFSFVEITQCVEELSQHPAVSVILSRLYHANSAFNEAISQNDTLTNNQFSEEEVDHLSALVTEYYSINRDVSYPPSICHAINGLKQIQPIYTFNIEQVFELMVSGYFNYSCFFENAFSQDSSPLYKVYEAIASSSFSYLDISAAMKAMRELPSVKEAVKNQIRLYEGRLTAHFQMGMRIDMPLEPLQGALQKMLAEARADSSPEFRQSLVQSIASISQCREILKQKASYINLFTAVNDFIKLMDKVVEGYSKESFFFSTPSNIQSALQSINVYFKQMVGSQRLELVGNLQEIKARIEQILADNRIEVSNLARDKKLQLIGSVYQDIQHRIAVHHQELPLEERSFSKL